MQKEMLLIQDGSGMQCSLADASGVPVRTIRALEQRQRSFSKLNLEYATSLAKCLDIRAEDLLRFDQ